jgi:hypothetical protein
VKSGVSRGIGVLAGDQGDLFGILKTKRWTRKVVEELRRFGRAVEKDGRH